MYVYIYINIYKHRNIVISFCTIVSFFSNVSFVYWQAQLPGGIGTVGCPTVQQNTIPVWNGYIGNGIPVFRTEIRFLRYTGTMNGTSGKLMKHWVPEKHKGLLVQFVDSRFFFLVLLFISMCNYEKSYCCRDVVYVCLFSM